MTRRPNTLDRRAAITDAMIACWREAGCRAPRCRRSPARRRLKQGLLHYQLGSREETVLAAVNQLAAGLRHGWPEPRSIPSA